MREKVATLDFSLANSPDSQNIHEFERGKPIPNLLHGSTQANLVFELKLLFKNKFRTASEVSLDAKPVASTPDLVLYPEQKLDFENQSAKRSDAPPLTVEIQSPTQTTDEMVDKVFRYVEFGVQSAWIVVPKMRAVSVYDRTGMYQVFLHHDDALEDQTLGIKTPLTKIFS